MKARKRKYCRKCGNLLKIEKDSTLKREYSHYFCPSCDENMFNFEIVRTKKKARKR